MHTRIPAACFLALGLVACSSGDPGAATDDGLMYVRASARAFLPLVGEDQPLVVVHIEGAEDAVFLVDTGAEYSWIDEDYVTRNGLAREPLGATVVDINHVEGDLAERAPVKTLRFGSFEVTGWDAPILGTLWEGVDGSIGQDLLRTMLVVFDGPGDRLILDLRADWDSLRNELLDGGVAYSYSVDWSEGIPWIRVPVADSDESETFWIDTGVGRMMLTPAWIERLGYQEIGRSDSGGLAGSSVDVAVVDVPKLHLQDVWFQGEALEGNHCALGWGVLREAVLVFDNDEDRMYLILQAQWKEPAPPDSNG